MQNGDGEDRNISTASQTASMTEDCAKPQMFYRENFMLLRNTDFMILGL